MEEPTSWSKRNLDRALIDQLERGLPASALWSLFLSVMSERASRIKPATLMQQWLADRFVAPAFVDQRKAIGLDRILFDAAADFEALELSPLAPLGACSVVAPTSQNRIVSTTRGTEVVSDPTNVLALESARRLRGDPNAEVRFATSHRCVRAQPVPKGPGFAAHFRIFCLTTAGHETKDQTFTVDALTHHVRTHLHALDTLESQGFAIPPRTVTVLSTPKRRFLADRIASQLAIDVRHESLEQPYYHGLRFRIDVGAKEAQGKIPLVDGGAFDWVAQLATNRKLVFVASAVGSQLIATMK